MTMLFEKLNTAPFSPRTALRALFERVTLMPVLVPPEEAIPWSLPEITTLVRDSSPLLLRIVPFGAAFPMKTESATSAELPDAR